MVLQNSEFDEGIGDSDSLGESWESRKLQSTRCRSFKTLIEVLRFCEARLLRKNIEGKDQHYSNISKALYLEASELKAFLGHVLHELDLEQNKVSTIEFRERPPELAKKYVKEWAQLWIKVMGELRQNTKQLKEKNDNLAAPIPPETEYYKCTPFDFANMGSTEDFQATLGARTPSYERVCDILPHNAEDRIFDFLKSRVSSQEELRSLNDSVEKDSAEENSEEQQHNTLERRLSDKKKLPVNDVLARKISNWDEFSLDDTLEQDYLDNSGLSDNEHRTKNSPPQRAFSTSSSTQNDEHNIRRRTSYTDIFDDSMSSLEASRRHTAPASFKRSGNKFSKSEVCLRQIDINDSDEDELCKVGASLTEIFKIRQELTRAEMDFAKDGDVKQGKKCFGCQKNKFTFFQRPHVCSVCKKKYCYKCIKDKIRVPPSLTDALPVNIDVTHDGKIQSNLVRSKSMLNIADYNNRVQLPWQRDPKLNGVRLSMCSECYVFVESIKKEKKKTEWTVQLELDL